MKNLAAVLVLCCSVVAGLSCVTTAAAAEPSKTPGPEKTLRPENPVTGNAAGGVDNPNACGTGLVFDDASAESGLGWVPSVIEGQYVQYYGMVPFGTVETVCICWLRTRADSSIDFDVVFYASQGDSPGLAPFASVPARADDVPSGVTGRFYEVDVSGVQLPPRTPIYIGARWDASRDQFFFICTDETLSTPRVNVFFTDDRANGWGDAFSTSDPIFDDYRASLIRVVASGYAVPAMSPTALGIFALFLALSAAWLGRRRRSATPKETS